MDGERVVIIPMNVIHTITESSRAVCNLSVCLERRKEGLAQMGQSSIAIPFHDNLIHQRERERWRGGRKSGIL